MTERTYRILICRSYINGWVSMGGYSLHNPFFCWIFPSYLPGVYIWDMGDDDYYIKAVTI